MGGSAEIDKCLTLLIALYREWPLQIFVILRPYLIL